MKHLLTILTTLCLGIATISAATPYEQLPKQIDAGMWRAGHIQGIAVDTEREHIYFSFTTMLVKADMNGNIIGTVTGLLGHLGCLEFNDADGRLYGSLEYKHDSIGKGILAMENSNKQFDTAFYVAIFDVDKINRRDMSAEKDGIMTTVYLPTVYEDYMAKVEQGGKTLEHRFGCSGFDGITFGPKFGKSDSKHYLTISYGIYGDKERTDNNYQVLLQYDTKDWAKYEQPLSEDNMHQSGPKKPAGRYFVYTGNRNWGVQNMEYDKHRNFWMLATYTGPKDDFANFTLMAVDGNIAPKKQTLEGVDYYKKGNVLTISGRGMVDPNHHPIHGWHFDNASTGIHSLGNNYFYISHSKKQKPYQGCVAHLYRFVARENYPFVEVK